MGGRLGMLGGTFDPLHIGHLVVAQDVVETLDLDRLLVVPAARPPHREAVLPAELRLALVRNAFEGDARIEASDLEMRREGPSYTVDTLAALRTRREPEALYCVIGVDQLRTFESWREPERIVELATVAVMSRGGDLPRPNEAGGGVDFVPVPVTRIDVSSSRIRERLAAGRSIRYLVPEGARARVEEAWRRRT